MACRWVMGSIIMGCSFGLLVALAAPAPVWAASFDCTKAAMPMDFVICSTAELQSRNDAHAEAWEHARSALDGAGRTALVESQKRWVKELTSTCRLPARGKPSPHEISDAQDCVREGLIIRTMELEDVTKNGHVPSPAPPRLFFGPPDDKAKEVLAQVLKASVREPNIAWAQIADGELPYLFVMDLDNCGASDCPVYGYRPGPAGWAKVYDVFGGDIVTALESKTDGHRDLRQYESHGYGENIRKISRWAGTGYGKPEEKLMPW